MLRSLARVGDEPIAVVGRLRDAVPGPNGTLWVLTNNTDGRGTPKQGDDKLLQVRLEPLREG